MHTISNILCPQKISRHRADSFLELHIGSISIFALSFPRVPIVSESLARPKFQLKLGFLALKGSFGGFFIVLQPRI
ncbi:hypothetical protein BDZ97DRAFT_1774481 [Flammula alnicola]|nr:hypothetical protein BDZ97DRAFT_1774481 [Flammula alnicola]